MIILLYIDFFFLVKEFFGLFYFFMLRKVLFEWLIEVFKF